jgi:vanillate O-demethylase monooxygenase subunit
MAPLSAGRVEGDELRCMYHGLRYDCSGACVAVPGVERIPPRLTVRVFPVVERSSWIWVWMGEPAKADASLLPTGWGLDDPDWHLKAGQLDYDADHQLIHDNLLDLSHLDYLHEKTLGAATGGRWSDQQAEVRPVPGGVHVSRWLRDARPPYRPAAVDTHTSYDFLLPGVFLQMIRMFPPGTAERHPDGQDLPEPLMERVDQQAVTPVAPGRSRYFYAPGVAARHGDKALADRMYDGVQETFQQDKDMIEAQARVLAGTDPRRHMTYIPVDQAPTMFRKLIAERLATEAATTGGS